MTGREAESRNPIFIEFFSHPDKLLHDLQPSETIELWESQLSNLLIPHLLAVRFVDGRKFLRLLLQWSTTNLGNVITLTGVSRNDLAVGAQSWPIRYFPHRLDIMPHWNSFRWAVLEGLLSINIEKEAHLEDLEELITLQQKVVLCRGRGIAASERKREETLARRLLSAISLKEERKRFQRRESV